MERARPAGSLPSARYGPHGDLRPGARSHGGVRGDDGSARRNDVWALSLAGSPAWSELAPAGSLPSARQGHTAVYDPVRDRMVVFGGRSAAITATTCGRCRCRGARRGASSPHGEPAVRALRHTAIYDPVRDRMVVFGGRGSGHPAPTTTCWRCRWRDPGVERAPPPREPRRPHARGHTAIYDPLRDRMVVFGEVTIREDFRASVRLLQRRAGTVACGSPA